MSAATYEFEGKRMTVAQVSELIPRYSRHAIRWYLRQGYQSRQEILGFIPENKAKKAVSAAAKRSAWCKAIHCHLREFARA